MKLNRRECLRLLAAAGVFTIAPSWINFAPQILRRSIPSTGEALPSIGLGTWKTFNVGRSAKERMPQHNVLQNLLAHGGAAVDTSPMYGQSEAVIGDLAAENNFSNELFIATKVWTTGQQEGIAQMNNSFSLLKRDVIDLMQVHNLVDWNTHYKTLRKWKEEGKIKYIGITHYVNSAHEEMEQIIKSVPMDFIQINYSITARNIENRLLRVAEERNVAVMINQPYNGGSIFRLNQGKKVPTWAAEFDCSTWPEFYLKYILADPAVTCIIPGTSNPIHMTENMMAGVGRLPNETQRKKMTQYVES